MNSNGIKDASPSVSVTDHCFVEIDLYMGVTGKIVNSTLNPKLLNEVGESVSLFMSTIFSEKPFTFVFNEVSNTKTKRTDDFTSTFSSDADLSPAKEKADSYSLINNNNSNDSERVFGSPLKLQTIADLSAVQVNGINTSTPKINHFKIESSIQGLPIQKARLVLKTFCLNDSEDSIVILCNADDPKKTIFLGAHKASIDGCVHLSTFSTTMKSQERIKLSSLHSLDLEETEVYQMRADYLILEKKENMGSILLQALWADRHGVPMILNMHRAHFTLKIAANCGFQDSSMYAYFKQLEALRLFLNTLKTGSAPLWHKNCESDAGYELQQLFNRIKKGDETGLMSMTCDDGAKINLSPQRTYDFTEKIWTILQQHCRNYEDIEKCMKNVVNALKKRDMSLYVHKDNKTTLAQFVRQSTHGMFTFPPMTGVLTLKMVVEIGMEKICNDYCSILVDNGLCSNQLIANFMKKCQITVESVQGKNSNSELSSSNEDLEDVSEWKIEVIEKLHHCLELVCLLDLYSDHMSTNSLVSVVLSHYETEKLDELHTFSTDVSAKQAIQQIQNASANTIRRQCRRGKECSVDCLLTELPDYITVPLSQSDSLSMSSTEYYAFETHENKKILKCV